MWLTEEQLHYDYADRERRRDIETIHGLEPREMHSQQLPLMLLTQGLRRALF